MSLGLAVGTTDAIYLAIDRAGAEWVFNGVKLGSKILRLEDRARILVTATMRDWIYVKGHYEPGLTLQGCANQVSTLLLEFHKKRDYPDYGAYARICGFEGEQPTCYLVDRAPGPNRLPVVKRVPSFNQPIVIGEVVPAQQARQDAVDLLQAYPDDKLRALREAVEKQIDHKIIFGPIDCEILPRPSS